MATLVVDDSNFDAATDPRAPSPRAAGEVGDIIAGRYELRERLGGGGGGTVFRAFDHELGEEVALKLLGAEIDADAAWRERVRSEVKLARRIASPHVCRVFDIGEAAGVRFLTMQLIDGESLQALLDRGALPAARGVAILRDVAEGLAAAHAEGILHRDLKPGNVVVRRDGRAVVVDFGLARAYSAVETGVVEVAGTPGYMSPEQRRGEPVAFASDVYSFGVVARQVVGDAPVLQPVIARALARRPADRYPSGKELRADIAAAVGDRPRRTRRWLVGAAAIAAVIAVAARPSPPRAGRPSVAVVGFKNLSGKAEDAWLSTASAEMLSTELGAGGRVLTIPGEKVSQMKSGLALGDDEGRHTRETLERMGRYLGADYVVAGSYLAGGDGIRIDAVVEDTRTGETLATVSMEGTRRQMTAIITRMGMRLRDSVHAGEPSRTDLDQARAALPSELSEAARLYYLGTALQLRGLHAQARAPLARAVELDPSFAAAHDRLGVVLRIAGQRPRARDEAARALALSDRLSREQRLLIEGNYWYAMQKMDRGVAQFQTLFELYPDNLEYCLKVARGQGRLAKREGYATVDACRALAGAAEDPRVDSVEAQVGLALGDHARARQAALTAVTKAETQRIDGVAKDAYRLLALAEMALGDRAAALTALNACRRTALTVEDGADVQRAARLISDILRDQGDLAGARREAERAAAAGAVLAPEFAILGFVRIAAAALAQGDMDGAERAADAAIALGADPEVEPDTLRVAREQRAQAALLRGDVAAAARWCPDSDKAMCRGSVLRARGDLAGAREAFAKVGERGTLIRRREEPARVLLEAGDAEAAENAALAMAAADRKQGRPDQVALDEIVAAEAALALGKVEPAAGLVAGARARAADSQDATLRFRAAIVGARVDAAGGDAEGARRGLAMAADQAGRLGLHELEQEARGALPAGRVAKGGH